MAEERQPCAFRTSIGGQALIEGIMMRGPEKQAIVVRDQEGKLVEKVEDLKFIKDRYPILGVPLIRGTVNFLAAMVNGVKRPSPPKLSCGWRSTWAAKSWKARS